MNGKLFDELTANYKAERQKFTLSNILFMLDLNKNVRFKGKEEGKGPRRIVEKARRSGPSLGEIGPRRAAATAPDSLEDTHDGVSEPARSSFAWATTESAERPCFIES